jgi:hypothetical protein
LQYTQILRTNLCAIIAIKELDKEVFEIHKLLSLNIEFTALVVCNVVNNKCHVSDISTAFEADSESLISQTIMISGSCLKINFKASLYCKSFFFFQVFSITSSQITLI